MHSEAGGGYVSVKMSPAPVSPAPVWSLVTSAMAEPWPPRTPCLINTNNSGIGTVTRQDALLMLHVFFCEAQGKGRAKGRPRKVTQRSFIDGGWWMVDILSLMLYIKFDCHHPQVSLSPGLI